MIVAAVLVAAGSGSRLGYDVPKAFVRVGGRTLLEHALERFEPLVRDIVIVVPAGRSILIDRPVRVVAGGDTRQLSVANGLAAVADDVELVLVHDVARPFVPLSVITSVIEALAGGAQAVIPVLPVTDTIRRVAADGTLHETLDRSSLVAVQTPQGFRRAVLARAHAAAPDDTATDDAALVEALGVRVAAVAGSELAFKITVPADLVRAEAVAAGG